MTTQAPIGVRPLAQLPIGQRFTVECYGERRVARVSRPVRNGIVFGVREDGHLAGREGWWHVESVKLA